MRLQAARIGIKYAAVYNLKLVARSLQLLLSYLAQGRWIDGNCQALSVGMQIGGGTVEHIDHQFHAACFDAIANDVTEQAVAADLRVEFAVEAQFDAASMRWLTGRCNSFEAASASSRL